MSELFVFLTGWSKFFESERMTCSVRDDYLLAKGRLGDNG
jgi:hypothetical protein